MRLAAGFVIVRGRPLRHISARFRRRSRHRRRSKANEWSRHLWRDNTTLQLIETTLQLESNDGSNPTGRECVDACLESGDFLRELDLLRTARIDDTVQRRLDSEQPFGPRSHERAPSSAIGSTTRSCELIRREHGSKNERRSCRVPRIVLADHDIPSLLATSNLS